jgi:methylenetetrahydrofolate reductase (NADPH)
MILSNVTDLDAMNLAQFYGPDRFGLSFELFPPKTATGQRALLRHVDHLMNFSPSYLTCTYGAGGSTRDRTLQVIQQVKEHFGLPAASHLTCVGATVDQLRDYLTRAGQIGVDFIVAIRGDPPQGQAEFRHVEGGLRHANELVTLIRTEFSHFGIAVAGYPETHQEAPGPEVDLKNLRRKVAAGADVVITQLFYDNDDFFSFRQRYEREGIQVPLVPGLLPVTNLAQVQHVASLCGARLPAELVDRLAERDDPEWQFQVGVEHAVRQVEGLLDRGVPGLHFYVLNKSEATSRVLKEVNLQP